MILQRLAPLVLAVDEIFVYKSMTIIEEEWLLDGHDSLYFLADDVSSSGFSVDRDGVGTWSGGGGDSDSFVEMQNCYFVLLPMGGVYVVCTDGCVVADAYYVIVLNVVDDRLGLHFLF